MPGASHLKQRYPSIVMPFVPPEGDEQRIRQEGDRYFRFLYSFNQERDANRFVRDYRFTHGPAIKRKTGLVWSVFAVMKASHQYW